MILKLCNYGKHSSHLYTNFFVYLESHKIGSHKKGSTVEKFMKPCVRESLGCYKQFNNQF